MHPNPIFKDPLASYDESHLEKPNENIIATIQKPLSLVSLAMFLSKLKPKKLEQAMKLIDPKYLQSEFFFSDIHLFASLNAYPILTKVVLFHKSLRRKLFVRHGITFIQDLPNCLPELLLDNDFLVRIDDVHKFAFLMAAAPQYASELFAIEKFNEMLLIHVDDLDNPGNFPLTGLLVAAPKQTAQWIVDNELLHIIQDIGALAYFLKGKPEFLKHVLKDARYARLRALLENHHSLARTIEIVPQCARELLADEKLSEMLQLHANNLHTNDRGLAAEFPLSRTLKAAPKQTAEWILDNDLLDIIQDVGALAYFLKGKPKFLKHVLKDARYAKLRALLLGHPSSLAYAIEIVPQCARELLGNIKLSEMLESRGNDLDNAAVIALARIRTAAPKPTYQWLSNDKSGEQLLEKSVNSKWRMRMCYGRLANLLANGPFSSKDLRDLLDTESQLAISFMPTKRLEKFVSFGGGMTTPYVHFVSPLSKDQFPDLDLPKLLDTESQHAIPFMLAKPELAIKYFFNDEYKQKCLRLITNSSLLTNFLTSIPELFPILYPHCYLLTDMNDIIHVMLLVSHHPHFDTTAKLPAVNGSCTWPLGTLTLTNRELNQLMQKLERNSNERSPLLQAGLLLHYVNTRLEPQRLLAKSDHEELAHFTRIQKCLTDALVILQKLYQAQPVLREVTKALLFDIESLNSIYKDEVKSNSHSTLVTKKMKILTDQTTRFINRIKMDINSEFSNIMQMRDGFAKPKSNATFWAKGSLWAQHARESSLSRDLVHSTNLEKAPFDDAKEFGK